MASSLYGKFVGLAMGFLLLVGIGLILREVIGGGAPVPPPAPPALPVLRALDSTTAMAFVHPRKCGGSVLRHTLFASMNVGADGYFNPKVWSYVPCFKEKCQDSNLTGAIIDSPPSSAQSVVVLGHFPYEQVDAVVKSIEPRRTLYCVTQSRDVIQRVISCIYFRSSVSSITDMTVAEFEVFLRGFRDEWGTGCNAELVRMFTNVTDENQLNNLDMLQAPDRTLMREDILSAAMRNLDQCVILLLESEATNQLLIKHWFPAAGDYHGQLSNKQQNRGSSGRSKSLPREYIDVIVKLNGLDIEIHRHAVRKHVAQFKVAAQSAVTELERMSNGSTLTRPGRVSLECPTPWLWDGVSALHCGVQPGSTCGPFFCPNGSVLVGASLITCENGMWSAPLPTCIPTESVVDTRKHCAVYLAHIPSGAQQVLDIIFTQLDALLRIRLHDVARVKVVFVGSRRDTASARARVQERYAGNFEVLTRPGLPDNRFSQYHGVKTLWESATNDPDQVCLYLHSRDTNRLEEDQIRKSLFVYTAYHFQDILKVFEEQADVGLIAMAPSTSRFAWYSNYWIRGTVLRLCDEPMFKRLAAEEGYYEIWTTQGMEVAEKQTFSPLFGRYQLSAEDAISERIIDRMRTGTRLFDDLFINFI